MLEERNEGESKYNISAEQLSYRDKINDARQFKCFVIMPIGKKNTLEYKNNLEVYNKIIKPCVENSGYKVMCYYADLIDESGAVSKQVIKALGEDTIVIADLRRRNPNVAYELGIRHTFGKRSIPICSNQSDHFFYSKDYRAIEYKIDGTSNQEFYNKLVSYIDKIITNPDEPDNPVSDFLKNKNIKIQDYANKNKKIFYVNRIIKGIYSLGSIYNKSNEDIIDLDIILEYIDKEGKEQKIKARVINDSDEPMRAIPYFCNLIKRKETKHVVDFPRTAVKIIIKGKNADSEENVEEIFDISEELKKELIPRIIRQLGK